MNEVNKKFDEDITCLRAYLKDMTKAYDRIENAERGINNKDIHLTKIIPISISDLINENLAFETVLLEIENFPDDRVREQCIEVLRVRQSKNFQKMIKITTESIMEAINKTVQELSELTKREYFVLKGSKWAKINQNSPGGGWLMVNMNTGDIHRILGYGKPNPRECIGNIFKMTGNEIVQECAPWLPRFFSDSVLKSKG